MADTTRQSNDSLPNIMRAWQYSNTNGGLEKHLQLNDLVSAPAAPNNASKSALVEVLAMSVNPADYKIAELPSLIANLIIGKPASPGMDFAGRLVHHSGTLQAGELVFGRLNPPTQHGALAQFVTAPTSGLAKLPEGVDVEHGAAIGTVGLTAYQSIVPYVREGDRVFINGGSGGVGTLAIQIAKIKGCHVVTSCSSANVQLCKDLGADEVIDYKATDLLGELKQKGNVFDLVVDLVGKPYGLHHASEHFLKQGKHVLQIGASIEWQAVKSMVVSLLLPGFLGGPKRPFKFIAVANDASQLEEMAKWTSEGRMRIVLDTVYPFEQAPKAYEKLKTGRARGKIVVSTGK